MKNGKFASRRSGMTKVLSLALALVLLVGGVVGGTIAWLTATSDVVVNEFTTSDIKVELKETTTEYKMIPGYDIAKDPKATVVTGSEQCWLFVKVEKANDFDTYMTYEMADGWEEVATGVYGRKVTAENVGTAYSVLKDDKVTVKGDVTKAMMVTAETAKPTLTFTAYASQLMKNADTEFTAAEAWTNVNPTDLT